MGQVVDFPQRERPDPPDIPSPSQRRWLSTANTGNQLSNKNVAGHRFSARTMRSCEWRGWARRFDLRKGGVNALGWPDGSWCSDDTVLWFITASGRKAIGGDNAR